MLVVRSFPSTGNSMQSGWRIGSLFGIPLYIDPSWLYIFAIFSFFNAQILQDKYSGWGMGLIWISGFLMTLLLFASVLVHELGHSLVARSQGIKVNSITLFLFGGVASIEQESKTPGQAFQVAIAGPVVSLTLCVIFTLLANQLPVVELVKFIFQEVASINLVLALFNLIPGLPLDGGQALKAAVWKITGNRFSGVRWAAKSGQFFGTLAIAFGLAAVLMGSIASGLWIGFIGLFILRNASTSDRLTDVQEALLELVAVDTMTRDFRVVDAEMTLRQFADEYILADSTISGGTPHIYPYFAASNGRYRGLVAVEDLQLIERSQWETKKVYSIVRSLDEIVSVQEKTPLVEVINCLEDNQMRRVTVLSPAGAVAGVIDRADIVRTVAQKLKLLIPDTEINRIKAEGTYPSGFQLQAIAKNTKN